jgi:hypothetical protein
MIVSCASKFSGYITKVLSPVFGEQQQVFVWKLIESGRVAMNNWQELTKTELTHFFVRGRKLPLIFKRRCLPAKLANSVAGSFLKQKRLILYNYRPKM